uniref:Lipocalin/cytosolic fatty-acid binding domain-containing protein n=1 Tax=Ursus americanus TaxID=9643 RepID=A0A452QBB9_URSAM
MKGRVLTALLGLYVALAAGTQGPVLKDFDFAKFSGLWYEIAFATKLEPQGSAQKATKVGAVVVELEDSHLALTEGRWVLPMLVRQIGVGGASYRRTRLLLRTKEVLVLATDYETYAIMDVVSPSEGAARRVLKLYSKPRPGLDGERGSAELPVPPAPAPCGGSQLREGVRREVDGWGGQDRQK